jgi:hypothetical protein
MFVVDFRRYPSTRRWQVTASGPDPLRRVDHPRALRQQSRQRRSGHRSGWETQDSSTTLVAHQTAQIRTARSPSSARFGLSSRKLRMRPGRCRAPSGQRSPASHCCVREAGSTSPAFSANTGGRAAVPRSRARTRHTHAGVVERETTPRRRPSTAVRRSRPIVRLRPKTLRVDSRRAVRPVAAPGGRARRASSSRRESAGAPTLDRPVRRPSTGSVSGGAGPPAW